MPLTYSFPRPKWKLLSLRRLGNDLSHIVLEDSLLAQVNAYRQGAGDNEAGGVLLGSCYGQTIRVEVATEPGGNDRATRHSFERCPRRAQKFIDETWQASGGRQNYFGEWHTHAEASPKPSAQDRRMIRQMFSEAQPHPEALLLLIVGTKGVWLGFQTSSKLIRLALS